MMINDNLWIRRHNNRTNDDDDDDNDDIVVNAFHRGRTGHKIITMIMIMIFTTMTFWLLFFFLAQKQQLPSAISSIVGALPFLLSLLSLVSLLVWLFRALGRPLVHRIIDIWERRKAWTSMETRDQYHTPFAYFDRFPENNDDNALLAFYEPDCSICLEAFQPMDPIMELKCGCQIIYHRTCLLPWLQKKKKCPICRRQFFIIL